MPGEIDVYHVVVFCHDLRLRFVGFALDAIRSAQIIARVEVFVVQIALSRAVV